MVLRVCTSCHGVLDALLGSEQSRNAILLVPAQPGFPGLGQSPAAQVVNQLADDDQDKGDGVHPVDVEVEDLDADADTPEVHGEQGDVEKGRGGQAEHQRGQAVEQRETQGEPGQVAAHLAVPDGRVIVVALEDGALHAVDDAAVERQLAQHLVYGLLADKVLLRSVGQTVKRGTQQCEQVTLQLMAARDITTVGTGDVIRGNENTHTTDADNDTQDLSDVIANLEEQERDDDDHHDGPEVDQLGAEHGGVLVGQHDEVVALDVAECEDDIFPAVGVDYTEPALESVTVYRVRSKNACQHDVVQQRLERGDGPALLAQKRGEGTSGGVGDGEQLSDQEQISNLRVLLPHPPLWRLLLPLVVVVVLTQGTR